mgnify:CR=1 FL=1
MTDRPVLFAAPMVLALLGGRKTQTRRPLKIAGYKGFFQFGPSDTRGYDWNFRRADHVWEDYRHGELLSLLPFQVGDRLWVREAWRIGAWHYHNSEVAIDYRDGPDKSWRFVDETDQLSRLIDQSRDDAAKADTSLNYMTSREASWPPGEGPCRWRPSIQMPRWASRLTLTVTDVRVQRLQDITEADAKAEGADAIGSENRSDPDERRHHWGFQHLWESINGPETWGANPWVTATSFTVHRNNIDQMEGAA